jgi:hypothetical protein
MSLPLMEPPLTTVRIPFLEIGRQLARMAIEKANSPRSPLPETVIPTELILRGTTWPHVESGSLAAVGALKSGLSRLEDCET